MPLSALSDKSKQERYNRINDVRDALDHSAGGEVPFAPDVAELLMATLSDAEKEHLVTELSNEGFPNWRANADSWAKLGRAVPLD